MAYVFNPFTGKLDTTDVVAFNGEINAGTEGSPSLFFTGDPDTGIFSPAANSLAVVTAGTSRMYVNSTGQIAVNGTPSGSFRFEVAGDTYINGDIRLKSNYPILDNTYGLGTPSFRWSVVYAATGTINTSDANLKQDIESLEQTELNVATAIKGLIKKFRYIDSVTEKGDDARIHVGVIAQEVEQAFINEGLDPRRYGLFCEDMLEDGSKRLGIRYDELLAFVIAAM